MDKVINFPLSTRCVSSEEKDPVFLKKLVFRGTLSGGLTARMIAEQVFVNSTGKPANVRYVFALPTQSAVVGCVMKIGGRTIKSVLKEKISAQEEYKNAVVNGQHANLLEQEEDNLFVMNVGNIHPEEEVQVSLMYDQSVDWQGDGVRFVIPLTHAPRCIIADTQDEFEALMRTVSPVRKEVPYSVDLVLDIEPGFTFRLASPSHTDYFSYLKNVSYDAHKLSLESLPPDRDFIMCLQRVQSNIQTVACVGSDGKDRFLGLTVFPDSSWKTLENNPVDIMFVLDCSGSMAGEKWNGLSVLVSKLFQRIIQSGEFLPTGSFHRVGVIVFNDNTKTVVPLAHVSTLDIGVLKNHKPDGGTCAGLALDYAIDLLITVRDDSRSSHIIFISDGETTDQPKALSSIVPVISIGIDSAVNAQYIKDVAQKTGGMDYCAYPGEDTERLATLLHGCLSGPVLRDLKVTKISADGTVVELNDVLGFPNVYSGRPAQLFVKCEFNLTTGFEDRVVVSGTLPDGSTFSSHVNLESAITSDSLPNLWARQKLRQLECKANPDKNKIMAHSLAYGVLSNQTCFVGVESASFSDDEGDDGKLEMTMGVHHEVVVMLPHTWVFSNGSSGSHRVWHHFRRSVGLPYFQSTSTLSGKVQDDSVVVDTLKKQVTGLLFQLDACVLAFDDPCRLTFEDVYNRFLAKLGVMVESLSEEDRAHCAYLFQCVANHFCKNELVTSCFPEIFVPPSQTDLDAIAWWQRYTSIKNG